MPSDSTVFVDTNVLLYAEDERDPFKYQRAREWLHALWVRHIGRTSTQVLNEFYVNATRKLRPPVSAGDARAEVRRYQHWKPWQIDHQTIETAWAIEHRFGFSFWDSLIVASAQHQGCRFLLSEDLQHEQRIGNLRILNPFKTGPEALDEPEV
ncbi:PIN domain-containing protein [Burkholderiaceae bacterium UC74_6]